MASLTHVFEKNRAKKRRFSIPFNAFYALLFLALFFTLILFFTPYSIGKGVLEAKNLAPSLAHPLGTDALGRDLLTRLAAGGVLSFALLLMVACTDAIFGTLLGILSALVSPRLQEIFLRIFDLLTVIPQILVAMVLFLLTGSGVLALCLTVVVTNWVGLARLVRGETLRLSKEKFFEAAICHGEGRWSLITKTLLPHLEGPLLIKLTQSVSKALYLEIFLSYLGLGITPPLASFGTLLSEGLGALSIYPWRALFPLLFLFVMLFSLHLLGDQLKERNDAR